MLSDRMLAVRIPHPQHVDRLRHIVRAFGRHMEPGRLAKGGVIRPPILILQPVHAL